MTFQIFIRLSTNVAKLRFLLYLQTMAPCQVKIQGNLFGMLITAKMADQWFLRQFFDMALSLVSLQVKKEDVGFVTELTGVFGSRPSTTLLAALWLWPTC